MMIDTVSRVMIHNMSEDSFKVVVCCYLVVKDIILLGILFSSCVLTI